MSSVPQRGVLLSSEEAKAAQEVAKLGSKALDLVGGGAGYLGKMLGELPHDAVGIFGDAVKRTRARLAERAEEKLKERSVAAPQLPSPSLLFPLLERADKETREELTELWAGLLATAMEPGRASRVRRDFFQTVEHMEPLDALVLAAIAREPRLLIGDVIARAAGAGISDAETRVSVEHLAMLKVISYDHSRGKVRLSPYGQVFLDACEPGTAVSPDPD